MNENSSGLTLNFEWNSMVRDIVRNLWAIVLAALIAWMGIYVMERSIYTPTYTSSAVLVVRSKVGTSGAYSNLSASSEMATIFTNVFKQASMKKLAAENLGLDSFDGTINAQVTGSTNLMTLSVKAEDPELAYELLVSILEVYPEISDVVFTDAVIDILSAPQMPTKPSNSALTTYRNQIILIAILLETGLIVLFSLLRGTVKQEKGFSDRIDAKLIGGISHERSHLSREERLKKKKRALLINDAYSSLRFTEDYQKVVTKLEYLNKREDKKVFAITSVAENEGKSTIAANIALALSDRGYNVALVDLDVHKPSIYKIFDFFGNIQVEFSDVLSRKVTLDDFKFYRYRKSNLIIAFNKKSRVDSTVLFKSNALEKCLSALHNRMDFVIIDTPPTSVSADAVTISSFADSTLLVVRTDCVAIEDINDTILSISDAGGNLEGCILNDVYKPFTLFGQMGSDETGNYGYGTYRGYSKYGRRGYSYSEPSGNFFGDVPYGSSYKQ